MATKEQQLNPKQQETLGRFLEARDQLEEHSRETVTAFYKLFGKAKPTDPALLEAYNLLHPEVSKIEAALKLPTTEARIGALIEVISRRFVARH